MGVLSYYEKYFRSRSNCSSFFLLSSRFVGETSWYVSVHLSRRMLCFFFSTSLVLTTPQTQNFSADTTVVVLFLRSSNGNKIAAARSLLLQSFHYLLPALVHLPDSVCGVNFCGTFL